MLQSLASQVRKQLHGSRMEGKPVEGFNSSTSSLLARYLAVRPSACLPILSLVHYCYDHNIKSAFLSYSNKV
jgi:hypothetical protein